MNATYATAIRPYAWALEIDGVPQAEELTSWGRADRARRAAAADGRKVCLLPLWTYPRDESDSDYWSREAWVEGALFHGELDGMTFSSRQDLDDYHWARQEAEAENGWLRAAENNDRYAWEEEQDRARAAYSF